MRKQHLMRLLAAGMALALLLAGCTAGEDTAPNPPKEAPPDETAEITVDPIRIVDILDREVLLHAPAERVVLTFSFEEYFAVTGEEGVGKIVGWSRAYWEGRRQSTWDVFVDRFPELDALPDVGYTGQNSLSVETILALEPDLVLMVQNDYPNLQTELERLDAADIPVLFVDYHQQSLANHCNSTLMIGRAMGMEARAQELADFYREQIEQVVATLADAGELERPTVYIEFSDAGGPEVFGATYGSQMWGAIAEQCGGDNIARDLVEGANGTILPEQILTANPQIIIFAGNQYDNSARNIGLGYTSDRAAAGAALASYAARPGWSGLRAVQNGRMYALYHDLSRHIFDFAGMQFFAKVIHPELFEDLDPDANLREFHDRFYPVDYTGVWFAGLEETP